MADDPLFARDKNPSDYEKMVLIGLFLSGQLRKHHAALMNGETIRVAVPTKLPDISDAPVAVTDEFARIEVATFKATYARHGSSQFRVFGSLRSHELESWLNVGNL